MTDDEARRTARQILLDYKNRKIAGRDAYQKAYEAEYKRHRTRLENIRRDEDCYLTDAYDTFIARAEAILPEDIRRELFSGQITIDG